MRAMVSAASATARFAATTTPGCVRACGDYAGGGIGGTVIDIVACRNT